MTDWETYASAPIPPYGPEDYRGVPVPAECGEELVDITHLHPRIAYDAAYLRQGLAGALNRCWVRRGVWERLRAAAERLPEGYSLLIFDSLRPLAVQRAIYDQFAARIRARRPGITPAELEAELDGFVALPVKRPERPTPHSTGGAVDLTLCYRGRPLDMGTGFDDLTEKAHTDWYERHPEGEEEPRRNRRRLYHLMDSVGLVSYSCEWWHYAWGERMWAMVRGEAPVYGFCPQCDFPDGAAAG
ncbi:MAG TPA: D-alanyl-D-alanine dipeptidase [Candidatus Galloscillospira excrementavium]|nr:D-alanyl-D-alanine dipeptidase [Candidatus Galloscillospira excrementavium]